MTNAKRAFVDDLESAGLSQRDLARLLGCHSMTVNRWCRDRVDALDVPQYARAFVLAYAELPDAAKRRVLDALGVPAQPDTSRKAK